MRTSTFRPTRLEREKGFTLISMAVTIAVLIGMLALAFDLGRAFLAKNEAQVFTDSASLEATMELDGTAEGIARAQNVVSTNQNRWNFGRETFTNTSVAFAQSTEGPWDTTVINPANYRYARVTTTVPVPLTFFPAVDKGSAPGTGPSAFLLAANNATMNVRADSQGGQEMRTSFREGLFPFSPFAHNNVAPHFGLTVGGSHTLRWASNPRLNGANTCLGDRTQAMIDLAQAGGGDERGFIEETSASMIRDTIIYDYQTIQRAIGESVIMTGGAKQTILDALIARVNQDTDSQSVTFADYIANGTGNGRRLVGAPINTGFPNYTIVQIGAFFLSRQQDYNQGGNKPFCAEYVGAWLQGGKGKAAAPAGAYVARLIR
jgi:Flp pilus assembly protein TadG